MQFILQGDAEAKLRNNFTSQNMFHCPRVDTERYVNVAIVSDSVDLYN